MASSLIRKLELLYQRMQEAGVTLLELDIGSQEKLRLARKAPKTTGGSLPSFPSPSAAGPASHYDTGRGQGERFPSALKVVVPLSGVFYRAPSPSSPPFVEEGSSVNAGDVLCIIEAMKVMNEIKAPKSGKILRILGANGKHVKKGDTLFLLEEGRQE